MCREELDGLTQLVHERLNTGPRYQEKDKILKLNNIIEQKNVIHTKAKRYQQLFKLSHTEINLMGMNADMIASQRSQLQYKHNLLKEAQSEVEK